MAPSLLAGFGDEDLSLAEKIKTPATDPVTIAPKGQSVPVASVGAGSGDMSGADRALAAVPDVAAREPMTVSPVPDSVATAEASSPLSPPATLEEVPAVSAAETRSVPAPRPSPAKVLEPIESSMPESPVEPERRPSSPAAPVTVRPPGSLVGTGLGRLRVLLEGPRSRVTDRSTETLSGRILGGGLRRLLLYANGTPREVELDGQAFQVAVPLQRGINNVRVVAIDAYGSETEDAVTLTYEPPTSNGIVIVSPRDGLRLTPDDPPIVVVEGEIEDKSVSTVALIANQWQVAVQVHAGRFRRALPVFEPVVRVRVEAAVNGTAYRSSTVTVHSTSAAHAQFGVIVFDWPNATNGLEVEVSAIWRQSSERLDVPTQTIALKTIARVDGGPADAFYLRNPKSGVYSFILRSRGPSGTDDVRSTLYMPTAGAIARKDLAPFPLNGAGRHLLARVLLPQGVFWEQDEWFSGRSESADTVTKFRFPDGVTWVERKADLR